MPARKGSEVRIAVRLEDLILNQLSHEERNDRILSAVRVLNLKVRRVRKSEAGAG